MLIFGFYFLGVTLFSDKMDVTATRDSLAIMLEKGNQKVGILSGYLGELFLLIMVLKFAGLNPLPYLKHL